MIRTGRVGFQQVRLKQVGSSFIWLSWLRLDKDRAGNERACECLSSPWLSFCYAFLSLPSLCFHSLTVPCIVDGVASAGPLGL